MMSKFSSNLTMYRKKANFTRQEIADKIGLSVTTYANYENGDREPRLDTLVQIATILCISIDELLGFKLNELDYVIMQLKHAGFTVKPLQNDMLEISFNYLDSSNFFNSENDFDDILQSEKTRTFQLSNQKAIQLFKIAYKAYKQDQKQDIMLKMHLEMVFNGLGYEKKQVYNRINKDGSIQTIGEI